MKGAGSTSGLRSLIRRRRQENTRRTTQFAFRKLWSTFQAGLAHRRQAWIRKEPLCPPIKLMFVIRIRQPQNRRLLQKPQSRSLLQLLMTERSFGSLTRAVTEDFSEGRLSVPIIRMLSLGVTLRTIRFRLTKSGVRWARLPFAERCVPLINGKSETRERLSALRSQILRTRLR